MPSRGKNIVISKEMNLFPFQARKTFTELISRLLPVEENLLPELIVLMAGSDNAMSLISSKFNPHQKVFQPISAVETRAVLSALFSKIHK